MNDEPSIQRAATEATKAVTFARAMLWLWGRVQVVSRGTWKLHRAIVADSLSTANRWRLNMQDFAKAHALVFWQAIGAGLLAIAEWVQAYVMPTMKAELDSSDWSKVAQVALLAAAVRLIVAMVQKGQQSQADKDKSEQW